MTFNDQRKSINKNRYNVLSKNVNADQKIHIVLYCVPLTPSYYRCFYLYAVFPFCISTYTFFSSTFYLGGENVVFLIRVHFWVTRLSLFKCHFTFKQLVIKKVDMGKMWNKFIVNEITLFCVGQKTMQNLMNKHKYIKIVSLDSIGTLNYIFNYSLCHYYLRLFDLRYTNYHV